MAFIDPEKEKEAKKYPNPIASRAGITQYLENLGRTASFEEISKDLNISTPDKLEALRRRLKAMERDGQIIRNRRNQYGQIDKMGLITGRVVGHRDGFGFLVPDKGGVDIFLPEKQMKTLFDGDRVLVRVSGINRRGRPEGALVEILERDQSVIVGRFINENGIAWVIPDSPKVNQQIIVAEKDVSGAKNGDIVSVALLSQPNKLDYPIGQIIEILGQHMSPGMEIDIALRSHHLPYIWSAESELEAKNFATKIPLKEKKRRLDLSHLPFVTIDGNDSKDFDDAVFCEKKRRGWCLWVAVADVAHYVKIGSAIDQDAQERGNSVYFPERVIPMLPEVLSNQLCSLNPNVERLAIVCEIHLTESGKLRDYLFHETVICSQARLTYDKVAQIFEGLSEHDMTISEQTLKPHLLSLFQLYKKLTIQRKNRGAIDFELLETAIIFGSNKKIERIEARKRNDAHRLIEEFMLMANICAADFVAKAKLPILYRNHLGPNIDKLLEVQEFLGLMGIKTDFKSTPKPSDYARILQQVADREDFSFIQIMLLRSLSQAAYQIENEGHFGLAYPAYTHFTSPIRRYPDLLVHRLIKHVLLGKSSKAYAYNVDQMAKLGGHCSMTERRADDATREVINWLKCEFMLDKVGQVFEGVVSGVTSFGLFVTLSNYYLDGLIHITALKNDYYRFDPRLNILTGARTGVQYKMGISLTIRVSRVDLDSRRIDFELAETSKNLPKDKGKGKKKSIKKKKKT